MAFLIRRICPAEVANQIGQVEVQRSGKVDDGEEARVACAATLDLA
jgi:hypothetical protein